MLTLSARILTDWTRALFGNRVKPTRAKPIHRKHVKQAIEAKAIEDTRAFLTLFDELDKLHLALDNADSVHAFYLALRCYHANVLDDDAVIAWLAELGRYTDIEQAYQIALERYAQKGVSHE